jgi:hypothetical protein
MGSRQSMNLIPTVSNAVFLVVQAGVEAEADAEADAEVPMPLLPIKPAVTDQGDNGKRLFSNDKFDLGVRIQRPLK